MAHLIIGYGEVGKALHRILGDAYWVDVKGRSWHDEPVEAVHICVPHNTSFLKVIDQYGWLSDIVIVHSSVPVGTCDPLGVIHSPIRGVHPHLDEGIRTFVKYFGGKNAKKGAEIFSKLGIKTKVFKEAKTTEALKLWDTTQYGRLIMLEKEIHAWCVKNKVSFRDIYQNANRDYNEGYVKLGRPEVVRPWLKHMPGPIGGHCVLPNANLLGVKL